jgi:hypothetical protein
MFLSEKAPYRLRRVSSGTAMGIAIWLLYVGYLILSNAIHANTSMASIELTLTTLVSSGPIN